MPIPHQVPGRKSFNRNTLLGLQPHRGFLWHKGCVAASKFTCHPLPYFAPSTNILWEAVLLARFSIVGEVIKWWESLHCFLLHLC